MVQQEQLHNMYNNYYNVYFIKIFYSSRTLMYIVSDAFSLKIQCLVMQNPDLSVPDSYDQNTT